MSSRKPTPRVLYKSPMPFRLNEDSIETKVPCWPCRVVTSSECPDCRGTGMVSIDTRTRQEREGV